MKRRARREGSGALGPPTKRRAEDGRPRFHLGGPRPIDGACIGGYQVGRLPTADEQATGRRPYDDE